MMPFPSAPTRRDSAIIAAASPTRDHRIDFWRGVALVMIFVNHIPGIAWESVTSARFGFSDAAEIFVFLAGFASAFAYGRPFLGGLRLATAIRALRRSGVLLLVHYTLSILALGLFCWAAMAFGQGAFLKGSAFWIFLSKPMETLVGVATLGHQFGYVNILPMYAVLLALMPAHLALTALFGRRVMLACAALLWMASRTFGINLPAYPFEGGWFFNPFAWQFVFAIGLFCGFRVLEKGRAVAVSPLLFSAACLYLLAAFVTVKMEAWDVWHTTPLPYLFNNFDKSAVTLPRLLHVLALIYVAASVMSRVPALSPSQSNPMAVLGRHSLPIFAIGTMLSLCGQVLRHGRPDSFVFDTLILAVGVGIMWGVAVYLDWWRVASKDTLRTCRAAATAGEATRAKPVPAVVRSARTDAASS